MDFNNNNMIKNLMIWGLFVAVISILTTSCYKDNEEELYPKVSDCDTLLVSYSTGVVPILESFCYACHDETNNASLASGVNLEGYDNLMLHIESGSFLSSIVQDGNASFMPKNSNKLADCNVAIIRNWINEGASNN
jgi:hypothetical protein